MTLPFGEFTTCSLFACKLGKLLSARDTPSEPGDAAMMQRRLFALVALLAVTTAQVTVYQVWHLFFFLPIWVFSFFRHLPPDASEHRRPRTPRTGWRSSLRSRFAPTMASGMPR